jgi:hypothetical protein
MQPGGGNSNSTAGYSAAGRGWKHVRYRLGRGAAAAHATIVYGQPARHDKIMWLLQVEEHLQY